MEADWLTPGNRFGSRYSRQQQNCCMQLFCAYIWVMTPGQFKRWLAKQGCTFEPGKGGHLTRPFGVRLDNKMSSLPMHGSRKEIGKGLEIAIKKDLGLK